MDIDKVKSASWDVYTRLSREADEAERLAKVNPFDGQWVHAAVEKRAFLRGWVDAHKLILGGLTGTGA